MVENKPYDLVKVLEDTKKNMEKGSVMLQGKMEAFDDIIKFINENKLVILRPEEEELDEKAE